MKKKLRKKNFEARKNNVISLSTERVCKDKNNGKINEWKLQNKYLEN
jgi:hypothetical protein